jgi:hypothetical protein
MNQINFLQDQQQHLTDDDIDRAIIVWRSVVRTIVKHMKIGYNEVVTPRTTDLKATNSDSVKRNLPSKVPKRNVALPFRRLDMHAKPSKISSML